MALYLKIGPLLITMDIQILGMHTARLGMPTPEIIQPGYIIIQLEAMTG